MFEQLLLPSGTSVFLSAVAVRPERVTVDMHTTASRVRCPSCQEEASRIHSHYQRTLADLPLAQIPVQIHLNVRRFFCDNPTCRRTTFAEPVLELAPRYARRTARLLDEQRHIGLELGGEPGARLACRQGMPISADTLLQLARTAPVAHTSAPRWVGIDDFALRKGQVYGTILVDLERHQPLDLLPERSAEAVAQWLSEHPGVEVITRDRSGEYADGASRGAPDAVQVADRFHLLQNVRELLQRVLERHQDALKVATQLPAVASSPTPAAVAPGAYDPETSPLAPRSRAEHQRRQERRAQQRERYQRVKELQAQGVSLRDIGAQVQLSRNTIRRYLRTEHFPERVAQPRLPSKLDALRPYLEQRLTAGEDNALELWRELREHYNYTGGWRQVVRWVAHYRHLVPASDPTRPPPRRVGRPPAGAPAKPAAPPARLSLRKAAWLLVRRPEQLRPDEQGMVERLCGHAATLAQAYALAQAFIQMVRERRGEAFDAWLAQMSASDIAEFRAFAANLEHDKAAVSAALSLPYSNGQVEGQVNRLKLIKRMAYGRAKFDLLRQRVLARAS